MPLSQPLLDLPISILQNAPAHAGHDDEQVSTNNRDEGVPHHKLCVDFWHEGSEAIQVRSHKKDTRLVEDLSIVHTPELKGRTPQNVQLYDH